MAILMRRGAYHALTLLYPVLLANKFSPRRTVYTKPVLTANSDI